MVDLDENQKKMVAGCGCCILLPTIIGLIAGSFGTVADTDMCLQYNKITQEMESKPTENQGTVFIGVDGGLVCFPRTVQKISFTESEGTRMITRTNEGLSVGVDVNIEYKLLPADLKRLHDLVETDYQRLYSSVANSGIRNAVSLYRAQDLLRDTTPLQSDIQTQLSSRFERFGATIIAVQVRQVKLATNIESLLQSVLNEGLVQTQQLAARRTVIATFNKEVNLARKDIEAYRIANTSAGNREVSVSRTQRAETLNLVNIQREKDLINARANRSVALESIQASLDAEVSGRAGKISIKQNELAKEKIDARTRIVSAQTNSFIEVRRGEIEREAMTLIGNGRADGMAQVVDAKRYKYAHLRDGTNMGADDILRRVYIESLEGHKNSELFVDYKKMPLSTEPRGNTQEIKETVGPGVAPTP